MSGKPDFRMYGQSDAVKGKDGQGKWVEMGACWWKNGSLSCTVHAIPISFNGYIFLHPNDETPLERNK